MTNRYSLYQHCIKDLLSHEDWDKLLAYYEKEYNYSRVEMIVDAERIKAMASELREAEIRKLK